MTVDFRLLMLSLGLVLYAMLKPRRAHPSRWTLQRRIPTGWLKFNESITERHLIRFRPAKFLRNASVRFFLASKRQTFNLKCWEMKFRFELSPFPSPLWLLNLPFPCRFGLLDEMKKFCATKNLENFCQRKTRLEEGIRRSWRRKVLTTFRKANWSFFLHRH